MKNKPIAFQLWLVMTIFVIFASVIVVFTVNLTVNRYFESVTLDSLKASQLTEMGRGNLSSLDSGLEKALAVSPDVVKHILISKSELSKGAYLGELSRAVAADIGKQKGSYGEYARREHSLKLFYIARSFIYNGEPCYLVSIYWDKEQNGIIYELVKNVVMVISLALLINITLAKLVSENLTAPIRYIEKKVSRIARKEWDTEIELNRKDEIGRLAASINTMKNSLKEKDMEEQTFIQTISHDLKTPVMVIRSYAQALLDKIYVNNSMDDMITTIETEAIRLESKIEKLLYLYSFDYIMNNIKEYEDVNLQQMIHQIVKKISLCRKEIDIYTEVADISIVGSPADLMQAFENILDNNLRYAESYIRITSVETDCDGEGGPGPGVEINFINDGKPISDTVIKNLFNQYQKGKGGHFGLGLFITKKIIEFHKGEIRAENFEKGVVFKVSLPLRQ